MTDAGRGQPVREFVADRSDARRRLDQAIVHRLTDVRRLSRTRVQRWIEDGLVQVNGRPARRSAAAIRPGDRVVLLAPEAAATPRAIPSAEELPVDVLFEDEHLLVVNKPAGLVAHPAYRNPNGTLLNALLWRFRDDASAPRPFLVHRLDKDTTGALMVARTARTLTQLQRALRAPGARKEYLAVVCGRPRRRLETIALPLARDAADRRRVVVHEGGRPSQTRVEVLASRAGLSLLRCELLTGRTHQIRVHLAANGWPIVGDRVYGDASRLDAVRDETLAQLARGLGHHALHAWRLTFVHPVTGRELTVTAPNDAGMGALVERLRRSS